MANRLLGPDSPLPLRLALFAAAYFAGAEAGHLLSFEPQHFATFWPPSGIYLAGLLIAYRREWPWHCLLAVLANLASDVLFHEKSVGISLAFGAGNTADALASAFLLQRFVANPFRAATLREMCGLGLLAPLCNAMSATVGATVVSVVYGAPFGEAWQTWWISSVIGVLVMTPAALGWFQRRPGEPFTPSLLRCLEGGILLACLVFVTELAFRLPSTALFSRPYPAFPFMLWAAVRFPTRGVGVACLLHAVLAVWHGRSGVGPFAVAGTPVMLQVFALQLYLSVATVTFLTAAAVIGERRRKEEELELVRRFNQRILDTAPVSIYALDLPTGTVLTPGRTPAVLSGYSSKEVHGSRMQDWHEQVHADDLPHLLQHNQRTADDRDNAIYELDYRLRSKSGEWVWLNDRRTVLSRGPDGRPTQLLGISIDITRARRAAEETLAALRDKETLLKEVHHRVKNNLAIVVEMLQLQANRVAGESARHAFRESQNRIYSMALVHEMLYQSADLARLDLAEYTRRLCRELVESHGQQGERLRLEVQVDPLATLDLDHAIPFSLLVGELVSNALKHAFPEGRSGRLVVTVRSPDGNGRLTLAVGDDGVGLAPGTLDRSRGLGLRLVRNLARQLGGTLERCDGPGTTFQTTFDATPRKEAVR